MLNHNTIDHAISRASSILLRTQLKDGSWDDHSEAGPAVSAQVLCALRYVNALDAETMAAGIAGLRKQQFADGAFPAFPGAISGDAAATALCLAAYVTCGVPAEDPDYARAADYLDLHGGPEAVYERLTASENPAAVYLSIAGLVTRHGPADFPLFLRTYPTLDKLIADRARTGRLIPLLQVWAVQNRLNGITPNRVQQRMLAYLLETLERGQHPDGHWHADLLQTALGMSVYHAAGFSAQDHRLVRAASWLLASFRRKGNVGSFDLRTAEDGATVDGVRVCLALASPESAASLRAALTRLVNAVEDDAADKMTADHLGHLLSVIGAALSSEAFAESDDVLRVRMSAVRRSLVDRLLSLQNEDGGWGAAAGQTDRSENAVTASALHGLATIGYGIRTSPVRRGLKYLQAQLAEDRTNVRSVAEIAAGVIAAGAFGLDARTDWVSLLIDRLFETQNADGGWGEAPISGADPSLNGIAASMPPLTGHVISALFASGQPDSLAVTRGLSYLLAAQRADGSWLNADWLRLHAGSGQYYRSFFNAQCFPLTVLAMYRSWQSETGKGRIPVASAFETPVLSTAVLEGLRNAADPKTDVVIEQVRTYLPRGVPQIFDLLLKSDDPIPEKAPLLLGDYFRLNAELPDWADHERIQLAQQFFSRVGWAMVLSLFSAALPQTFAAPGCARILNAGPSEGRARRRILESAQFLLDVTWKDAFSPGGRAVPSILKVRLLHAAVRFMVDDRKALHSDRNRPISQFDLLWTNLTYSVVILEALDRLHIAYSEEEADAWMHLWRVVGRLLGIPDDQLPDSRVEAAALAEKIRENEWRSTEDGRILMQALMDFLEADIPGRMFRSVPAAVVYYLGGEYCGELLAIGQPDWNRILAAYSVDLNDVNAIDSHLERIFRKFASSLLNTIANLFRESKSEYFRIPAGLLWDLDEVN